MDLVALLIQIVVGIIVVAPILWLVGRALVGGAKSKIHRCYLDSCSRNNYRRYRRSFSRQFDLGNNNVCRLACID